MKEFCAMEYHLYNILSKGRVALFDNCCCNQNVHIHDHSIEDKNQDTGVEATFFTPRSSAGRETYRKE